MITTDYQDWWWYPNYNMDEKFDGMYMKHPANKHEKWSEEKQRNR